MAFYAEDNWLLRFVFGFFLDKSFLGRFLNKPDNPTYQAAKIAKRTVFPGH